MWPRQKLPVDERVSTRGNVKGQVLHTACEVIQTIGEFNELNSAYCQKFGGPSTSHGVRGYPDC
jgi:hypothetical protein